MAGAVRKVFLKLFWLAIRAVMPPVGTGWRRSGKSNDLNSK